MEGGNAQFLAGLQEGDGCIPRDCLWRCSEHGLFLHHHLQPRKQKKVGGVHARREGGTHTSLASIDRLPSPRV
jgi:hypothetical protein